MEWFVPLMPSPRKAELESTKSAAVTPTIVEPVMFAGTALIESLAMDEVESNRASPCLRRGTRGADFAILHPCVNTVRGQPITDLLRLAALQKNKFGSLPCRVQHDCNFAQYAGTRQRDRRGSESFASDLRFLQVMHSRRSAALDAVKKPSLVVCATFLVSAVGARRRPRT
jgi:hypothetical protein